MPGGTSIVDNANLAMDSALTATGVRAAQQNPQFAAINGAGVTTVIIDTGIDLNHPFFGPDADQDGIADRIVFQYDFADGDANAGDVAGHGSHVSGLIASQDAMYYGVAPGADIIALKVFEDSGKGYFSYLEQALQWVIANQETYHIGVVNLSLGDGGFWTDTFSRYGLGDELAALADMNVIVVAAAGNYYASRLGLAYPASDPAVIAVGATWAMDFGGPWRISTGATDYVTGVDHICAFSQRDGDLLDVFAPGARLNNANAAGGVNTMQGTSQAAAFVSGIATLSQQIALQELGRGLTTAEFALLLQETSDIIIDGDDEVDNVLNTGLEFGRINFLALAERILSFNENPADGGSTAEGDGDAEGLLQPAAPGKHAVTLNAGQSASGLDFGNFKLGEIHGVSFEDLDGDGAQEPGEASLSGRTVYLDADANGQWDTGETSTVTDESGNYSFSDLGPGTYKIAEVLPAGWVRTAPVDDTHEVTMTSGLVAADKDFGSRVMINAGTQAGDGSADAFRLVRNGEAVELWVNDGLVLTSPFDSAPFLRINGSSDNDTLTVDWSQGNPVPEKGIAFDGIGTGDIDKLVLTGGPVSEVVHTLTTATSGTVTVDGAAISYRSVGLITDNLTTVNRTFQFGDSADTITFRPNRLSSTGTGATVEFSSPSGSLTVNTGGGNDRLTVESVVPAVPVAFQVVFNGGLGNDTINAGMADYPVKLWGGDGTDILTGGRKNDFLFGGDGNDTLKGGPGDDYLEGGLGTDTLLGGPGKNILIQEVNEAPVLAAIGNREADEGAPFTLQLSASDANLPAQTLTYSVAGSPTGATFNPATGLFSWTPAEDQGPGTYELTFGVTDGVLSDAETIQIQVNEVINAGAQAGDGSADTFRMVRNGDALEVYVNESLSFTAPWATAPFFKIKGSGDNDTLTVDWSQGNPLPVAGIAFDGVASGDIDKLVLTGGSVSEVVHTLTNATSGRVTVDGATISYLSAGLITDSLTTANRTFQFGDSADTLTFRPNRLSSTGTGATVEFSNTTASLRVNTGGGNDRLTVESVVPAVPVAFEVIFDGGSGNDTINAGMADYPVTLVGGDGTDTLTGGRKNDFLYGGDGDDILKGGPGDDYLEGGPGTDTLLGGPGVNTLVQDGTSPLSAASAPTTASVAASTAPAGSPAPMAAGTKDNGNRLLNGSTLALEQVQFRIADVSGPVLGQVIGNTILADRDAAGRGWFTDSTSASDSKLGNFDLLGEMCAPLSSPAVGTMDLLSAVLGDVGHVPGFEPLPSGGLEATLPAGEGHLPTALSSQNHDKAGQATVSLSATRHSSQERVVMVFDEAKGEFSRPGIKSLFPELRFDPAQWDAADAQKKDNNDDWIVQLPVRKLHG